MELVVATGNEGKLREIKKALANLDVHVLSIAEFASDFDVDETGDTFLENAWLKAQTAFEITGKPVVADDSGLCVEGLDLAPGVHSARYGGPGLDDDGRVDHLLAEMDSLAGNKRRAWFACTLVAIVPFAGQRPGASSGVSVLRHHAVPRPFTVVTTEGRLTGQIGHEKRGFHGFGYDPIFRPDPFPGKTLAEVSLEKKNRVSHRGKAFEQLARYLKEFV